MKQTQGSLAPFSMLLVQVLSRGITLTHPEASRTLSNSFQTLMRSQQETLESLPRANSTNSQQLSASGSVSELEACGKT